jgi:DNA-binding NarL/FixJ family response regulator
MSKLLEIDPGARAIVSSGYSNDPVMANYRAHGFRGVMPKPYTIEDMAQALTKVLKDDPDEA